MITRNDVILAFSWSGETVELGNLVSYSRRFAVPLIAVTSNPDSTLAKAAEVVLALPHSKEACPHGLAPTTSTTMQLALGDCLAIALLESKGFTARDFQVLHPGGQLGARLKLVGDLMATGPSPNAIAKLKMMKARPIALIHGAELQPTGSAAGGFDAPQIPELDRLVSAGGRKQGAVGRKGYGANSLPMSFETLEQRSGRHVPEP